ncbi:MAG: hypothetical protein RIC19_22215 [Phaeodactylibacter sp.]|uniref:hypothetical protein n=1 Tax=Phaeodactylibacter sp. TaxID=1940289 RepID=UPI0032EFB7FF
MKELTLKIPDQLEGRQIKEMIAHFLFKNHTISAQEAAEMAELEVSTFLLKNRQSKEEDNQSLESMPAYMASVKPVRKHVTLEEMKAEQDYHPIIKADFFAKAKAINIEEPLEELLGMLD